MVPPHGILLVYREVEKMANIGNVSCFAISPLIACEQPRCQGSAPRTIARFVPAGLPVTCEDSEQFELDGGMVSFTRIRHGKLMKAAEGDCISSRLCAIEDDELDPRKCEELANGRSQDGDPQVPTLPWRSHGSPHP